MTFCPKNTTTNTNGSVSVDDLQPGTTTDHEPTTTPHIVKKCVVCKTSNEITHTKMFSFPKVLAGKGQHLSVAPSNWARYVFLSYSDVIMNTYITNLSSRQSTESMHLCHIYLVFHLQYSSEINKTNVSSCQVFSFFL